MAKAVVETRTFTNPQNGEIIKYTFYGIVGVDSSGERMELNLAKLLDKANKIAFKVVAETDDLSDTTVETRKSTKEEEEKFKDNITSGKKTILDDDEDDGIGGLF